MPPPPLLRDQRAAWAAVRSIAGPLAARITIASLPPTFRDRVQIDTPVLSDALMVGAYRGTGLAARCLPMLTNPWALADLLDSDAGDEPGSAGFGALLRGASAFTTAVRTGPSGAREHGRHFPARPERRGVVGGTLLHPRVRPDRRRHA